MCFLHYNTLIFEVLNHTIYSAINSRTLVSFITTQLILSLSLFFSLILFIPLRQNKKNEFFIYFIYFRELINH